MSVIDKIIADRKGNKAKFVNLVRRFLIEREMYSTSLKLFPCITRYGGNCKRNFASFKEYIESVYDSYSAYRILHHAVIIDGVWDIFLKFFNHADVKGYSRMLNLNPKCSELLNPQCASSLLTLEFIYICVIPCFDIEGLLVPEELKYFKNTFQSNLEISGLTLDGVREKYKDLDEKLSCFEHTDFRKLHLLSTYGK